MFNFLWEPIGVYNWGRNYNELSLDKLDLFGVEWFKSKETKLVDVSFPLNKLLNDKFKGDYWLYLRDYLI